MNTNTPERATLREAIERCRDREAELAMCRGIAVNAAVILADAEVQAAQYANLDQEIAAHRATQIKAASRAGGGVTRDLPPELARRIADKAEANAEVERCHAAQVMLANEVADAEHGVLLSMRAVYEAADAVIRSEGNALARQLAHAEAEAAALRQQVHAYVALATDSPSGRHSASTYAVALVESQPKNATIKPTQEQRQAVSAYHAALTRDADAPPPPLPKLPPRDPEAERTDEQARLQVAMAQAQAWAETPRSLRVS